MDYNFDDRLLWEKVSLNKENFHDERIKLNGIYYRYESNTPINLGDKVVITGVKGNILLLEKDLIGDNNVV